MAERRHVNLQKTCDFAAGKSMNCRRTGLFTKRKLH